MSTFDLNSITSATTQSDKILVDTEEDAKPIIDNINKCPDLQLLTLTGNTLGVAAAQAIAKVLENHPELKICRWSDMFTGRIKTEISAALSALGDGMIAAGARLSVLDLSDNEFGPIGVEGLAKLLQSDVCSQLQELRLNNNGLGITGGRLLAKALSASPRKLKVFIAGRNRLENEGATALAKVFQEMGTLEELAMPQNNIDHAGVAALAAALRRNPRLACLNLNDNTVGARGAAALAAALPRLKNLRSINFGDCLLKSKGAKALAEAFKKNSMQLESLDLSHNEIGKAACMELVESITGAADSADRLTRVVLAGNSLGGAASKKSMRDKLGASAELGGDDASDAEDSDDDDDDEASESEDEEEESEAEGEQSEDSATEDAGLTVIDTKLGEVLDTSGVEEVVGRFLSETTGEIFANLGPNAADVKDTHLQVELLEKQEQWSLQFQDEISVLLESSKEKDAKIDELNSKITKAEQELETFASVKLDLETKFESKCKEYDTQLTDWEVSYETLAKKAKTREQELLALLEEHSKKMEEIGLQTKNIRLEPFDFMDMSKDISLVNMSDNESSSTHINENEPSGHQNLLKDIQSQLAARNPIIELETNISKNKLSIENYKLKGTIHCLNSRILKQHKDIKSYNDTIQELRIKLINKEKLRANNDNSENIIQGFKIALDCKNKEIDTLKSTIDANNELSADYNILKEQIELKESRISALIEEAEKLKNQLNENITEINKLIRIKVDLTDQLSTAQVQNATFLKQNIESNKKIEHLNKLNFAVQIEHLQKDNEKLSHEVAEQEVNKQEMTYQNQVLTKQIEDMSQKISDLEKGLKEKEHLIKTADSEERKYQELTVKAQAVLVKFNDTLSRLNNNTENLPETVQNLENFLNILHSRIDNLEAAVIKITEERDVGIQAVNELKEQLSSTTDLHNTQLATLLTQTEKVKNELVGEITAKLDAACAELATKNQCIIDLEIKLNDSKKSCENLRNDILSKENCISELQEQLASAYVKIETLTQNRDREVNSLRTNLEEVNQSLERLTYTDLPALKTQFSEQIEKLANVNLKLFAELKVLKEENIKLKKELHDSTAQASSPEDAPIALESRIYKDMQSSPIKMNGAHDFDSRTPNADYICQACQELQAAEKKKSNELTVLSQILERTQSELKETKVLEIDAFTNTKATEELPVDQYSSDKLECFNFYLEKTGDDKENMDCDVKIIEVMKMLYNNLIAKHGNEVENLMNKLRQFEELKNQSEIQLNNASIKYIKLTEQLKERDENEKALRTLLDKIRGNTNLIQQEMSNVEFDNTKLVNLFKANLRLIDYDLGLSLVNKFESIIDNVVNKHQKDLTTIMEQYDQLKIHNEKVVTEFNIVNDNLKDMKSQLCDKEKEYNLLKAQKERMYEISNAVTLDIVKKENELTETLSAGWRRLVELDIVVPYDSKTTSVNENMKSLFQHLTIQGQALEKKNININALNDQLVASEKTLTEQKTALNDVTKLYEKKVEENKTNEDIIRKISQEIEALHYGGIGTTVKETNGDPILKLHSLKVEYDKLKTISEMVIKERDMNAVELEKARETIARNKAELDKMTSDILVLRESVNDNESLTLKAKSLRKQNIQLQKQFQERNQDCSRLETNIKTHEKTAEMQSKMIIRLQKQKAEADKQTQEAKQKLSALESECNSLKEKLKTEEETDGLKNTRQSLEQIQVPSECGECQRRRSGGKGEEPAEGARQSLHDSQRAFGDHGDDSNRSSSDFNQIRPDILDENTAESSLRGKMAALEEEVAALTERNRETCAQYMRDEEQRANRLRARNTQLQGQIAELSERLRLAESGKEGTRPPLVDASVNTDADWANLPTKNKTLTQTIEQLRYHKQKLKNTLAEMQRDDGGTRGHAADGELRRVTALDKALEVEAAFENQLLAATSTPLANPPMFVATGSAIVQNQQITDVMKDNQKLKKINAKLTTIAKLGKGSDANRENEEPSDLR